MVVLSSGAPGRIINNKKKNYSEVKFSTVVYQLTKNIHPPFYQLMASPQTKKQPSKLNHSVSEALDIAKAKL